MGAPCAISLFSQAEMASVPYGGSVKWQWSCGCIFNFRMTWTEGGFCCLPPESRIEGGRRQGSEVHKFDTETRAVIRLCLRGSCRLPRSMASSGNGKIVRQEQLGAPTRNPPDRRLVAG
jgi:hypothetical protein